MKSTQLYETGRLLDLGNQGDTKAVAVTGRTNGRLLLIIFAAMTGALLEVLDSTITTTALPQIQGNLGATLSEVGWVNTAYFIANVIVLPMAGWLAMRFGRRNYFAGAIVLFTVASTMCGLSQSLDSLVFWRVVQGLGGGGLLATGQVILMEAFPPGRQAIAAAIFGVGITLGPLLGPVLGGYLTENYSWPWIFLINLPFGIVAAILTWINVDDGEYAAMKLPEKTPIDFIGIILLCLGMGSMQATLERGQEDDWFNSSLIVGLAIMSAVSLSLLVWWELRAKHPVLNLRALKNRSLTAGALFAGVFGCGLYGTIFLLPVYLQNLQGYSVMESGMVQFPPAMIATVSFMAAGLMSEKKDPRLLLLFGTLAFIACPYGLSHLTSVSSNTDLYSALVWRSASVGFLFVPLAFASLNDLKPEDRDTGSGIVNFMRQLGGSVGIAVLSTELTNRADFHRAALVNHISSANPVGSVWLNSAKSYLTSQGYSPDAAAKGALVLLDRELQKQSMTLAFDDCFLTIAVIFLFALPLILLFRKSASRSAAAQTVLS